MSLHSESLFESGQFAWLNQHAAAYSDDAQGSRFDLVFKMPYADAQFLGGLAFGEDFRGMRWGHGGME
jgi:hypothetical protein